MPKLQWGYVPLLQSWKEHEPEQVTIDDTLILFTRGDIVINDRWFRRWDAIDYPFPGGHAFRDKWSKRLTIRTAGAQRKTLIYHYSTFLWFFLPAWYQVVPRIG